MMRKLVWFITFVVLAVWSAIAWIAHAVVGVGGNLAASNADLLPADPEVVELVSWLAQFGAGAGEWLIAAIWAVVSAVLLAIGFIVTRLLPRFKSLPSS